MNQLPSTTELQRAFSRSVLHDDNAILPWIAHNGLSPESRMRVYRHIIENILADALRTSFPAVLALVGEAFFTLAADGFMRAHPPESGNLQEYGANFPRFLEGMEEAASLPYLAAVAQLEWARQRSFLAPDAIAIDASTLAKQFHEADTHPLYLALHPSVQLLRAEHPVFDIWRYATEQSGEPPRADGPAQSILIWRADGQISMQCIAPAEACFLRAIRTGAAIQQAWEQARAAGFPDFDLSALLPLLIANNLIVDLTPEKNPGNRSTEEAP